MSTTSQKKTGGRLLPILIGGPVSLILLVAIIARGGIVWGTLFDLAFLVAIPPIAVSVFRRYSAWPLLSLLLVGLWLGDLILYLKSIPVNEFVLMPLFRWLGGIRTPDEHGWIIRTVLAALFLLFFVKSIKSKMTVSAMFTGAVMLMCLGFLPLAFNRIALATSVNAPPPGTNLDPKRIEALVADRPGQLVDVHASTDNNLTWGRQPLVLDRGDVLVVQFIDEPDAFYFRNMRRNREAMRDPSLISGTYDRPCGWKYEDFRGVAKSSMPLPEHPLSTTAIRLGGGGYQPILGAWNLYEAVHKGEVNFGYNFPRGLDSYMNANANGHRRFMVWVIRADEARQAGK